MFQKFHVSEISCFRNFMFQKFHVSEISGFINFRFPKFQVSEILECVSEMQASRRDPELVQSIMRSPLDGPVLVICRRSRNRWKDYNMVLICLAVSNCSQLDWKQLHCALHLLLFAACRWQVGHCGTSSDAVPPWVFGRGGAGLSASKWPGARCAARQGPASNLPWMVLELAN